MGIVWIAIILLAVAGGIGFFLRQRAAKRAFPRYDEKSVLNKGEAMLFGRLCRALPDCYVFPQVTLSNLMEPSTGDRKKNPAPFERIEKIKVNFAIVDKDFDLMCVVVLDPESSESSDPVEVAERQTRKMRDRCLKSATIKVIRWNLNAKPSVEQIARAILPLTTAAKPTMESSNSTISPDTVQRIYKAEPHPSNIRGLTEEQLDNMTPNKVLCNSYPHIWQRICLFAPEPKHLQKYLISLSIQDRGEKRAGFPIEALKEIADIQIENDRFLLQSATGWQPAFVNR